MANLSGTQKKKRNQFVALLVAILVVAAAIFYVVFSAYMAKSGYLENQDFATAIATALDKSVRNVKENDLEAIKYVEIYNDGQSASVYFGYEDFVEQYDKYMAEVEAAQAAEEAGEEAPEITTEHPVALAVNGAFETGDEELVLNDIKYFTGAEVVSFSGFSFDPAAMSQYKNLREASFSYCGLTNEALATIAGGLDLAKIEKLTFMGESIDDWSPLESISDKVTISNYSIQMDENGQYSVVPTEQTLTEYLEEKAKAEEEAAKAEAENAEEAEGDNVTEEASEETTEEVTDGEEATETNETAETTEVTE